MMFFTSGSEKTSYQNKLLIYRSYKANI